MPISTVQKMADLFYWFKYDIFNNHYLLVVLENSFWIGLNTNMNCFCLFFILGITYLALLEQVSSVVTARLTPPAAKAALCTLVPGIYMALFLFIYFKLSLSLTRFESSECQCKFLKLRDRRCVKDLVVTVFLFDNPLRHCQISQVMLQFSTDFDATARSR